VGLDLLAIVLRLEMAFGIKFERGEEVAMLGQRPLSDLTAGQVYGYVFHKVRDRWPDTPGRAIAADCPCAVCRYNLRGLFPGGVCPECGTPTDLEAHVTIGVRRVLAEVLGADPHELRPDSRLFEQGGGF
jgi:hypothetical protein